MGLGGINRSRLHSSYKIPVMLWFLHCAVRMIERVVECTLVVSLFADKENSKSTHEDV